MSQVEAHGTRGQASRARNLENECTFPFPSDLCGLDDRATAAVLTLATLQHSNGDPVSCTNIKWTFGHESVCAKPGKWVDLCHAAWTPAMYDGLRSRNANADEASFRATSVHVEVWASTKLLALVLLAITQGQLTALDDVPRLRKILQQLHLTPLVDMYLPSDPTKWSQHNAAFANPSLKASAAPVSRESDRSGEHEGWALAPLASVALAACNRE